jgi:hypothetical protein
VPLQTLVCMQKPEPEEVVQGLLVQHFMSEEPGQRPAVYVPEQQPAETLTHTPSIPPDEQVAE